MSGFEMKPFETEKASWLNSVGGFLLAPLEYGKVLDRTSIEGFYVEPLHHNVEPLAGFG